MNTAPPAPPGSAHFTTLVNKRNGGVEARPKKTGAPTKFTPRLVKQILRAVGKGVPTSHAARAAGVSFQTVLNFQKQHPKFADSMEKAISKGIVERLNIVERAMKSVDENVALRAAIWHLSHSPHSAQFFSENRRVEFSGELDAKTLVLVWPHQKLKPEVQVTTDE
jgi:hypothetical protein